MNKQNLQNQSSDSQSAAASDNSKMTQSNPKTQSRPIWQRVIAVVVGVTMGWIFSAIVVVSIWGAPELADGLPEVYTTAQETERIVIAVAVSFIFTLVITELIGRTKKDSIIFAVVGALITVMTMAKS